MNAAAFDEVSPEEILISFERDVFVLEAGRDRH